MLRADCAYGFGRELGHCSQVFHPGLYVIHGANGVGKTTLLRTLAGEVEVLSGTVSWDERPVYVGWLSFYADLTIGEHVRLLGYPDVQGWELEQLWDMLPHHLSSGQKQRAFVGLQLAALSPGAPLLIDEPERHLDSDWQNVVVSELKALSEAGHTVVAASHLPALVDAADHRISL